MRWFNRLRHSSGDTSFSAGIYKPLQDDEIRVLLIKPGAYETDLRGKLITQRLSALSASKALPYEALSYAWGDPIPTQVIQIGNQDLGVATNLFVALRHLRHETQPRILWCDAICINQADLTERGQQVQIMNLVYKGAESVLVWLGEQNHNSDVAFDAIEKWAVLARPTIYEFAAQFGSQFGLSANETVTDTLLKALRPAAISSLGDEAARDGQPRSPEFRKMIREGGYPDFDYLEATPEECECLSQTFHGTGERSWWSRRWVIQEVMNGRTVEVLCGKRSISWSRFMGLQHSLAYLATWNYPAHSTMSWTIAKSLHSAFTMAFLRDRGRLFLGAKSSLTLEVVLERFARTHCSEPLDVIYSVLNISNMADSSISVDYIKNVNEVFASITKLIITRSRNLTHLACPGPSHSIGILEGPSWMRDYSAPEPPSILIKQSDLTNGPYFSAAGSSAVGDYLIEDARSQVLHLKGVPHDTVVSATRVLVDNDPRGWDTIRRWRPDFQESMPYPGGGDNYDAFWRTLQKDTIVAFHTTSIDIRSHLYEPQNRLISSDLADFRHAYSTWLRSEAFGEAPGSRSWRHPQHTFGATRNNLLGYCFVTSSRGYMGVVHGQAEAGDEIDVVEGAPVPLVLRRVRSSSEGTFEFPGENDFHTLVGVAYVHGIMDGQVWEKVLAGEKLLKSLLII